MDMQTLSGKLPLVVARRAAPVPVIAVVGHNGLRTDHLRGRNIRRIHALNSMTAQSSANDPDLSAALLVQTGRNIAATLINSKDTIRS